MMPKFFFDVFDGAATARDEIGTELADIEAVQTAARRLLPDIARDELPSDGDRRMFTVLVRTESGVPVYSATLTFAGLRLDAR